MRAGVIGFCFALLAANISLAAEPSPPPAMLTISQGALAGTQDGMISIFKNIPYAAPPVGPLRWRAPQPAPSWQGTRAADQYGASCPQQKRAFLARMMMPSIPQSEDCLTLNVWTPNTAPGAKLPVMVWIYGGAFVEGSAAFPFYDGAQLAKHGVVVVTLNYRLGWLGFFNHPALAAESPNESHGNYGLMDQIAALEWVKNNIASFGGDPSNVTIFGESAGGVSVNALMTSPRARGLFAKAISESGLGLNATRTGQSAQTDALSFAERQHARGDDAEILAKLRALDVDVILDDQKDLPNVNMTGPLVDGTIVPQDISTAFARGEIAKVPYMAGSNSNEASLMPLFHTTPDKFPAVLGDKLPIVRKIYEQNGALSDDAFGRQFFADAVFASGAQAFADFDAKLGFPSYVYHFAYVAEAQRNDSPGVNHGGEIVYVFGIDGLRNVPFLSSLTRNVTANDLAIVAQTQSYWTNFARTGDPNGLGLPQWSPTTAAMPRTLVVGNDGTKTVDGFHKNELAIVYLSWTQRTGIPGPN